MNDFIYRQLPLPGGCRGFILEDAEGDFNIYLNADLSEEQLKRTVAHEEEHARRGDTRSQLTAMAMEKVLKSMKFDK